MLITGSTLKNRPILSLHIGGEIARIEDLIIDPNDLKIVAFEVFGSLVGKEMGAILETRDIREISSIGMIVDSSDVLVNREDVIRLDKVMEIGFQIIGKKVVTKKGTKLGKVEDFITASDNFEIVQLIVQRPLVKAFIDPELTISRSEIVEVDDEKIVVKDEEKKIREKTAKEEFKPNFVNPFREQRIAETARRTVPTDSQNPGEQDS
ncbi:PRC-barrel domain-containing protein [Candidatus Saccharibacteria bacterium]|nr:PRC-barrel domain-containing protein [Candidatus Saccharibacteria bacterium]